MHEMIPSTTIVGPDVISAPQKPHSRRTDHQHGPEGASPRLPRLVVVSYLAHAPFSPRGARTRALLSELRRQWTVEHHGRIVEPGRG